LARVFAPDGDTSDIILTSERKILTVGATGSVGRVHIRDEEEWFLHDDALAIELLSDNLDLLYCRFALQMAIDEAHYDYSAKLYRERLLSLTVRIPETKSGEYDLDAQKEIASILNQKEQAEYALKKLAESLRVAEIRVPYIVE
jgi:hypothetical protein